MILRPFLLALLLVGAMAAQPGGTNDRRRAVGVWLVEDVAEEDGGRIVRVSRRTGGVRITYHLAFWRGNAGPIRAVMVERGTHGCGGEEPIDTAAAAEQPPPALRALLAGQLEDCGIGARQSAVALRGVERALALAAAWARDAEAATAAEAAALADYGAATNRQAP